MKVYFGLNELPKVDRVVTVGVFDGMHLGHRALIQRLIELAELNSWKALALTFINHPQEILQPPSPPLLTTKDEKLSLLEQTGLDETLILQFTKELSLYSAHRFCQEIFVEKLGCRLLVVGHDFALGHQREGNVPRLQKLGKQLGFKVEVVEAITNEAGRVVSSSHIRNLLQEGNINLANELLGRAYQIRGIVVCGSGRGRAFGFPTINLQVPSEKILPMYGIYAGKIYLPIGVFDCAIYIGTRPTFGETYPSVEAHILGFNKFVEEGTIATITLSAFLRPDQKFDSVEELVCQICEDVEAVRKVLRHN